MKKLIGIRISALTETQLAELTLKLGMTQTEAITMAVDLLYSWQSSNLRKVDFVANKNREDAMIEVKNAWYIGESPIIVVELPNGDLMEIDYTPFRFVQESEMHHYSGSHPDRNKSNMIVKDYILHQYGLKRCIQK